MASPPFAQTNLASNGTPIDASDVTNVDDEIMEFLNNIVTMVNSISGLKWDVQATPATPAAGEFKTYFKSTGFYLLNSSGVETKIGATLDSFSEILRVRVFS